MIVRSHVAYGGSELIITGLEQPWNFKKGTRAFSRGLEDQCRILHIADPYDALTWCRKNYYSAVAVEIDEQACFLDEFSFPGRPAIIVGNEKHGLDPGFIKTCGHVVTIKQFGEVGSLNVGVSASTAMYEFRRNCRAVNTITGSSYRVRQDAAGPGNIPGP